MKKSIAIIGEGETEWFYFDSLRVASRYPSVWLLTFRHTRILTIF